jgi:hypothetical protein
MDSDHQTEEYIQLKNELNNYRRDRNMLNTFMITTFVAILALFYGQGYASYIFLFAQALIIPILVRLVDYKRMEAQLAAHIREKFTDDFTASVEWEQKRYNKRLRYFEFLTLSAFVTMYFLREASFAISDFAKCDVQYFWVSAGICIVIGILTFIGNAISIDNTNGTCYFTKKETVGGQP